MDVDELPPEYREDLCCPFPEACYNWMVLPAPSLLLDCPVKGYAIFSMAASKAGAILIVCQLKTLEMLSLYICLVQSDELPTRY
jgi:hypothetical protein